MERSVSDERAQPLLGGDIQELHDSGGYATDLASPPSCWERAQFACARVVEHLAVSVLMIALILTDGALLTAREFVSDANERHRLETASTVLLSLFVVELAARVFARGLAFFRDVWNLVDAAVVLLALLFSVFLDTALWSHAVLIGRLLRLALIVTRLRSRTQASLRSARQFVGGNKQRFQRDGFDLDLAYVTPRVIAMSAPSTGGTALFRNPIEEVVRFLDVRHADHYFVFNVTEEQMYDEALFHRRVERLPIQDHNVAPLRALLAFGARVQSWMEQHPANVIAVHCRGGKGRTGLAVCTWLMHSRQAASADASMDLFGRRRTDTRRGSRVQGVETPSQVRYLRCVERALADPLLVERPCAVRLRALVVEDAPGGKGQQWAAAVQTFAEGGGGGGGGGTVEVGAVDPSGGGGGATVVLPLGDLECTGDIKFTVFRERRGKKRSAFCYFWLHTSFLAADACADGEAARDGLRRLTLYKGELDKLHKDMDTHRKCSASLRLHVTFSVV